MKVKNDLFDYENRYIIQDSDFFKFSLDSILLAEYVEIKDKDNIIIDLCTGNMAIPLILSKYTNKNIVGFELQEIIYNMGVESIMLNQLSNQLSIINDDVKNLGNYYHGDCVDIMLCNPPFFKYENDKLTKSNPVLKKARHEVSLCLEDIFIIAQKHLTNKGALYMVHRSDRVDEIINLGYKYQVYVKEIQFISTKNGVDPRIVLLKCVKNSNQGIKIKHEICIENVNTYKGIFKRR